MPVDPFNTVAQIFRNRQWIQTITSPNDLTGSELALVVISPVTTVLVNTAPSIVANSATFVFLDSDTAQLTAGGPYRWQALSRTGSGSGAGSTVIVAGPLVVFESPPWPL
jgi:hypothetical protein